MTGFAGKAAGFRENGRDLCRENGRDFCCENGRDFRRTRQKNLKDFGRDSAQNFVRCIWGGSGEALPPQQRHKKKQMKIPF